MLAEAIEAYDNRVDVAYLVEAMLLDEMGFIEGDPQNTSIRLTAPSRQNWSQAFLD
ncbi:MAG: hypothetical protein WA667_08020 [Candidatus Nitrosopolaris sp.]